MGQNRTLLLQHTAGEEISPATELHVAHHREYSIVCGEK
jgi:hypothetical protein